MARLRPIRPAGGYPYLLSLPDGYDAAPRAEHRWPLLLFLHGSLFRGDDVVSVGVHGLPRLLNEQPAPPLSPAEVQAAGELAQSFIVVAPQCPRLDVWDDARLLALLDEVSAKWQIDPARIYLTGLSMGGFGAWSVAMRHPQRFAALAPICGGGRLADIAASARDRGEALRGLGVWAFHGAKDIAVPLEESQRMIEGLRAAGAKDARLTVYPEAEHDAWTATYTNLELYAWMLGHTRGCAGRRGILKKIR